MVDRLLPETAGFDQQAGTSASSVRSNVRGYETPVVIDGGADFVRAVRADAGVRRLDCRVRIAAETFAPSRVRRLCGAR